MKLIQSLYFIWCLQCVQGHKKTLMQFMMCKSIHVFSCFQFQTVCVSCLSARGHFKSIFNSDVMAMAVFGNFVNTKINQKGSFELNLFVSICLLNYQSNVMWYIKTTQIVHSKLYFSCFYIVSELCGNLQYIAVCIWSLCMVIYHIMTHVPWCVLCEVACFVFL